MKLTKEDLLQFLQKESDLWVPLSTIMQRFPGEEKEVIKVLNSHDAFAKSRRTTNGEELFASRSQVRDEGNLVDKLIGAFKNRID